MAFSAQGVLGHDSWCFRNMKLQALKWKRIRSNGCLSWKLHWVKIGEKGWLSILWNISIFSSKVTYNVLNPNMAFHLEFALYQKRWHEIELLNEILKLEPFKISNNLESYELLKLVKIMKWPIIFCILRASSIHFLTLHIKEGINFTSSRSFRKKNGLKVIRIGQVMII